MKENQATRHEMDTGICIFNRDNERSVYNLVSNALRDKIDRLELQDFNITERRLKVKLKPDQRDTQLRVSFWNEYYAAQDKGRQMVMRRIVDGICTDDYFYNTFIYDKNRLIYMLLPVSDYKKANDEMFHTASSKMRDILDMPLITTDKNGNKVPDYKLMAIVNNIHKRLDDRIHGAAMQNIKIDQTQKSVNLNLSAPNAPAKDIKQLEAEIKLLEAEIKDKRSSVDAEYIEAKIESDEAKGE